MSFGEAMVRHLEDWKPGSHWDRIEFRAALLRVRERSCGNASVRQDRTHMPALSPSTPAIRRFVRSRFGKQECTETGTFMSFGIGFEPLLRPIASPIKINSWVRTGVLTGAMIRPAPCGQENSVRICLGKFGSREFQLPIRL